MSKLFIFILPLFAISCVSVHYNDGDPADKFVCEDVYMINLERVQTSTATQVAE